MGKLDINGVGTTFVNVCYALYINIFIYDNYRAFSQSM